MIKTIGHSNHPIGRFVDLLKAGGVEAVVDVRSTPYSRRFPQFGRERLAQSLSAAGILYRYEGAALGGLPARSRSGFASAKAGKPASYDEIAQRTDFKEALDRLVAGSADTTAKAARRIFSPALKIAANALPGRTRSASGR